MCTKESKMNYKFDGSKVYFTSDTHFYHSNIIGFCKRLFKNVEDMNETLIENWNQVVSQDDIVFQGSQELLPMHIRYRVGFHQSRIAYFLQHPN